MDSINLPDNLTELLDNTPYGKITVELHRQAGVTQKVLARQKVHHKTPTPEEALLILQQSLVAVLSHRCSGRLEASISFYQGELKYTIVEAFLD